MRTAISFFLFVIFLAGCKEQPTSPAGDSVTDVLNQLQNLPGVTVTEISPQNGYARQFELFITQPLDHSNPAGPVFQQRVYISHVSQTAPVVFLPSGYSSNPVKVAEISTALQANQVYAAHRFMTGARPANMDWQFLTVEQSAKDFHNIVKVIKKVYKGPWISYGISKNGTAALFHKRYFPADVSATVAISASLSLAAEDPRYENFLNNAGTAADREKIIAFQRAVLKKKIQIISRINNYMSTSGFNFTRMNAAEIIEFEVLEFPFSFWQTTDGNTSGIPDTSSTDLELFNYMKNFGYFDFYSDELLDYYEPVYYQAFTETGWYRLIDDNVKDLLTAVPNPSYRMMAPRNTALNYSSQVIPGIINWLQSSGNNIVYIYGSMDPWSAGAIPSVGSTNAIKITKQGGNHDVSIADIPEKSMVYSALRQWMGLI